MELVEPVALTQTVKAGGCASKLPPGSLQSVLARLPKQHDERLLVGFETSDDAGIYQITPDLALVQTVDFFTPLVDDPFTFGQIAAANALSDVYAMGGKPINALALVCFPEKSDLTTLEQILRGGLDKMNEAGCAVVGGHSVKDAEVKFGYAVTGLIDPSVIHTNAAAKAGDELILTKALGIGVITTALKRRQADARWVDAAIRSMTTLNRTAADVVSRYADHVHAITDVTGFGLIGHGRELAIGSRVVLEIDSERLPLLDGAVEAVHLGAIPGGLLANREFAECVVTIVPGSDVPPDLITLMYDPQTSGGLLISVSSAYATVLQNELCSKGLPASRIGRVLDPQKVKGRIGEIRIQ